MPESVQERELQEFRREYAEKAEAVLALDVKRRESKTDDAVSWTEADQDAFDTKAAEALEVKAQIEALGPLAQMAADVAALSAPVAPIPNHGKRIERVSMRTRMLGENPELIKGQTGEDGTAVESYLRKNHRIPTGIPLLAKAAADAGMALGSGYDADQLVIPDYTGEMIRQPNQPLVADQMFGAAQTNVNVWKYFVQGPRTFRAAFVSNTLEGSDTKPQSRLPYELVTETAGTIAHYIPVHKSALRNIPQLMSLINDDLPFGLRLLLDEQVIWGDGTGDNLTGVVNRSTTISGIPGCGVFTSTGTSDTDLIDDIKHMATQSYKATWILPTVAGLTPELQDLLLTAKASGSGEYVYGIIPFLSGGVLNLNVWGLKLLASPVFQDPDTDEDNVIVGNPAHGKVVTQEDTSISVGWVDKQFVQNAETVLAETTVGLEVSRPYGYVRMAVGHIS